MCTWSYTIPHFYWVLMFLEKYSKHKGMCVLNSFMTLTKTWSAMKVIPRFSRKLRWTFSAEFLSLFVALTVALSILGLRRLVRNPDWLVASGFFFCTRTSSPPNPSQDSGESMKKLKPSFLQDFRTLGRAQVYDTFPFLSTLWDHTNTTDNFFA